MTENHENSGGQGDSLDVSVPADRVLVARAAKARWQIPDELKTALVVKLGQIVVNSDDARDVNGAARTLVAMEGQNQADDHVASKNERLDSGKPTEVAHVYKLEFDE